MVTAVNWRRIVDVLSGSEVPTYASHSGSLLLDYCPHCGAVEVHFLGDTPGWRRSRRMHKLVCQLTKVEERWP